MPIPLAKPPTFWAETTRWQGMIIGMRFLFSVLPTARLLFGFPIALAISIKLLFLLEVN